MPFEMVRDQSLNPRLTVVRVLKVDCLLRLGGRGWLRELLGNDTFLGKCERVEKTFALWLRRGNNLT
jgi:hypothetical protein